MADTSNDLQAKLFGSAMRECVEVSVFLVKGLVVRGKILDFDNFTILLANGNRLQMFVKSSVSSVEYPPWWVPKDIDADTAEFYKAGIEESTRRVEDGKELPPTPPRSPR